MRKGIHPDYKEATITCACGEVIRIGSTSQNMHVEICSKCHPFYTGKYKLVDTTGRVERFTQRVAKKGNRKGVKKDKERNAGEAEST
ncbi:MAG: 50S ribosomal protein L31 [bacterium]